MKIKLITTLFAVTAALSSVSEAVTVTVSAFASTTSGLITLDADGAGAGLRTATGVSGTAYFVSVTTALTGVSASMNTLLASTTSTMANFQTALGVLITGSNNVGTTPISASTNPGLIAGADRAFTNGAFSTSTQSGREAGSAANNTYLFIVAESGGFITGIGAYTGPAVPALPGALNFGSANVADGLGIGTSVAAAAGAEGPITNYQLAPVVAPIPEPSAALLGALGALGLLRRRRI